MNKSFNSFALEQKIGQLFIIGIAGTDFETVSRQLLREITPGGICLFSRNLRTANQTRRLLENIAESLPVKPILTLDQEGGPVDRLRRVVTPMPSVRDISVRGSLADAAELARITAEVVRILGFNMNFAPVADVLDEEREKFSNNLYSRIFGKSVGEVSEFVDVYLENLQAGGCLGAVKHFPGLGATEVDSHDELPTVNISKEELYNIDIEPYRKSLANRRVFAVMVGHAAYPQTDLQETASNGKLLPASLNFKITSKLLRDELGFGGLVITDDLEMGAIMKHFGIGEACKMAIIAGVDMLSICAERKNITDGFQSVLQAVRDGEISEARIDESLDRIFQFKSLLQEPLDFSEDRLRELSNEIAALNERLDYQYGG